MKIYPFFLQKMVLPLTDCVLRTAYRKYIKEFSRLERSSREEIVSWQNQKLRALMVHVYNHVPFYREFMKKEKITPDDIRSAEDLRVFPVLDKQIIKERFKEFVPDNLEQIKCYIASTGGSTGVPLKYYMSNETQSALWAKKICVLKKYDFQMGEKYLALGSSSIVPNGKSSIKASLFHKLLRMVPLSAANMDDEKCRIAVDLLRRNKIRMIYGYASAIYLLAKYVLDNEVNLHVDICMSTSEKLTEHYEDVIRKALGGEVIDAYGSRDAGLCSYRCNKGRFHMIETCLYRLTDDSATTGAVVATNLINYAMPFINYNVEDIITADERECDCGSSSFVFENVVGRQSQVMTLANGRTITGPAFTVLFSGLPVKCYQIAKVGECAIEVRIQSAEGYSEETEQLILKSLKTHAGEDCSVAFNYDYQFVQLKNGKRDYFIIG